MYPATSAAPPGVRVCNSSHRSWIAGSCEPVERKNATKTQDFKKAAADRLGVSMMQIGPILTAAGINPHGIPNVKKDRVAVGMRPQWTREGTLGLRVREVKR